MRVSEIFYSLQGEGFLAGTPSVFIRLAGCSLRCKWCDTKYAWHQSAGRHYSIEKIIEEVVRYECKFVVITGGEPMMNTQLPELTAALKKLGKHITIETVAVAFMPEMICDLMSISPKLSNSIPDDPELAEIHTDNHLDIAILGELIDHYKYQLKFVIDSPADIPEIKDLIQKLGNVDLDRVMLMPQAATKAQLLEKSPLVAELCKSTGYAFSQRLHILLWGNKKGV